LWSQRAATLLRLTLGLRGQKKHGGFRFYAKLVDRNRRPRARHDDSVIKITPRMCGFVATA
jgi:hypothetical protein